MKAPKRIAVGPLVLAIPLLLAGPCGRAAGQRPVVCTLSADSAPIPALHGRARVVASVREGGAPLEGAEVGLRVESGPGQFTDASVTTGPDGTAMTGLASGRGGPVVVSAALTGRGVGCGNLELTFADAQFPIVQPDLVRWMR